MEMDLVMPLDLGMEMGMKAALGMGRHLVMPLDLGMETKSVSVAVDFPSGRNRQLFGRRQLGCR